MLVKIDKSEDCDLWNIYEKNKNTGDWDMLDRVEKLGLAKKIAKDLSIYPKVRYKKNIERYFLNGKEVRRTVKYE